MSRWYVVRPPKKVSRIRRDRSMSRSVYHGSTVHPPAYPNPPGAGGVFPPCILLDNRAYLADHRNHTTALSKLTHDGTRRIDDGAKDIQIQVTFFGAHPPCVSYYCAYLPGLEPSKFAEEPHILATEANLALFRVVLGPLHNKAFRDAQDYCVYQTDGAPNGGPSLTLLPRLHRELLPHQRNISYYFRDYEVGLLRYCTTTTPAAATTAFTLRRHCTNPYDGYIVAALICRQAQPNLFDLCTFDSQTKAWSNKTASLPEDLQQHGKFQHDCHKVITIGGEAGTMGWVDLSRGILFCDVRDSKSLSPLLRYLPLPEPLADEEKFGGIAMDHRDIAIIRGRIKCVELEVHHSSDGWSWKATTWSTTVTNPWEVGWHQDHKLHSSEVSVPAEHHGSLPQPTLEGLLVVQPTLCLDDNDTVYLKVKVNRRDRKAWVVALDMRNKIVREVAVFGAAPRTLGIYMHSRISSYLNVMHPGTEGHRKLPGMPSLRSSRRKRPKIPKDVSRVPMNDYAAMSMQHSHGEENHQDAAATAGVAEVSGGVEDGDIMDL